MGKGSPPLKLVTPEPPGQAPEPGRIVSKTHLVNRLNYLNFQDQTILVALKHVSYDNSISLRARPEPCNGERLECHWGEVQSIRQLLSNYRFDCLLIPDGKKYLLVNPEVVELSEERALFVLPVSCREYQLRKIKRHQTAGITLQLSQHGAVFQGEVLDFTPVALKGRPTTDRQESFYWINPETPLNLRLFAGKTVLFSGACDLLWQTRLRSGGTVVLKPLYQNVQRFKQKRFRNLRQRLVPAPSAVFEHPLTDRRINLKVHDVSGTGFSVDEAEGESVLMAGMIIPELRLSIAPGVSLRCRGQVVFRNPQEGACGEGLVRCGIAILDMNVRDHEKLLSLVHQVADHKQYLGPEVDLDELWNFFFETGFIYPDKYAHFQANKEQIKKTYARLYEESPQIARHFIYQERGTILGHMAMVRCYQDAWLIHHHAARKSVALRAGIAVLNQITRCINELNNFYFAHLQYVYCYYRPDNRFPSRVFGAFANYEHDPRVCSQDAFGYFRFRCDGAAQDALPEPWELVPSTPFDRSELVSCYAFASGGLMVDAFNLLGDQGEEEELAREYRRLGFKKEVYSYSLRREGSLKAFLLVNCSDAGLNLAELTNCVTVVVLDGELPAAMLTAALDQVSRHFEGGEMPVLAYPQSYLERNSLTIEKVYQLWILNLQYIDAFCTWCERLFRDKKSS